MSRPWLWIAAMLLTIPVLTTLAIVGPNILSAGLIACCGTETSGAVVAKNESIEFVHENWLHRFDITFNFQRQGNPAAQTATNMVDAQTFDRLKIGDQVRVRYLSGKWTDRLPDHAVLMGSSLWDRIPVPKGFWSDTIHVAALFLAATILVLSGPGRMRMAGLAGTAGLGSGIYMAGWLIYPTLFVLWRKRPGKGYGFALLASLLLGAAVMAERMPWPGAPTENNTVEGTAVVNQIAKVDRIWAAVNGGGRSTARSGVMINRQRPGIAIDPPYFIVDLRLLNSGMHEPVHAVDRIDADSIPGLFGGTIVPVRFPHDSPRTAVIAGAKRDFAFEAWIHLLVWTLGTSLLALPLAWPIVAFSLKAFSKMTRMPGTGDKGRQLQQRESESERVDSSAH